MFRERILRTSRYGLPARATRSPAGGVTRPSFGNSGANLLYILDSNQPKGKKSSLPARTPGNLPTYIIMTSARTFCYREAAAFVAFWPLVPIGLMLYFRYSTGGHLCRQMRRGFHAKTAERWPRG